MKPYIKTLSFHSWCVDLFDSACGHRADFIFLATLGGLTYTVTESITEVLSQPRENTISVSVVCHWHHYGDGTTKLLQSVWSVRHLRIV